MKTFFVWATLATLLGLTAPARTAPIEGSVILGTVQEVDGQPFDLSRSIEIKELPRFSWLGKVSFKTSLPIKTNDVLHLSFWARATKTQEGRGSLDVTEFNRFCYVDTSWKHITVTTRAKKDFDAGSGVFGFFVSSQRQTLEIGGLKLVDYGVQDEDFLKSLPDSTVSEALNYAGRTQSYEDTGPAWFTAAKARIEKYRKGDLSVIVQDAKGQPIQSAQVNVAMTRHAFRWANRDSSYYAGPDAKTPFNKEFRNQKFLDTDGKGHRLTAIDTGLEGWLPANAPPRYWTYVDWLRANGFELLVGTNLWGRFPDELKKGFVERGGKLNTAGAVLPGSSPESQAWVDEQVRAMITSWVTDPRLKEAREWILLNEIYFGDRRDYEVLFGPEKFATKYAEWFQLAHTANPNTRFSLTEAGLIEQGGYNMPQIEWYRNLVSQMRVAGRMFSDFRATSA